MNKKTPQEKLSPIGQVSIALFVIMPLILLVILILANIITILEFVIPDLFGVIIISSAIRYSRE